MNDVCDETVKTPKFLLFVDALTKLCQSHRVMLSVSGYDGMQVWDLHDDKVSSPIYCAGIDDCTEPNISKPTCTDDLEDLRSYINYEISKFPPSQVEIFGIFGIKNHVENLQRYADALRLILEKK